MPLHGDWVYIPWEVMFHKRLSPEAKLVFGTIITEDEMPSLDDVAEGTHFTVKRVRTALEELERKGFKPVPGTVSRARQRWTTILGEYGLTPEQAHEVMCAPAWGTQVWLLKEFGLSTKTAKEALNRIRGYKKESHLRTTRKGEETP